MSKSTRKNIEVFADWVGLPGPTLIGYLYSQCSQRKELFSFEYDLNWLNNFKDSFCLDPSLQHYHGVQYHNNEQDNFGVFLDSSPDRWGRVLMRRREEQLAREEGRNPHILYESDYLLGVFDELRNGALRFRKDPSGSFLDTNKNLPAPPWASLRELEFASLEIEKDNAEINPKYSKWLHMLIAPGGSLGGARPKASVIDEKKHLWIAKFPSRQDDYDVGAWEMIAHKLAKRSQINVPDAKIQKFNSNYHTFISKRFDRGSSDTRLHFVSAMTLLQRQDGDDATSGVSYLELVDLIIKLGAQPDYDLEQLWRRIVFYICISNTDDHLRNHGFILSKNGWMLSPAFDINPVAFGHGLKLNISEADNSQDIDLALSVSKYFRINSKTAKKVLQEIVASVKKWKSVAKSVGIPSREIEEMSGAFRLVDNYHGS